MTKTIRWARWTAALALGLATGAATAAPLTLSLANSGTPAGSFSYSLNDGTHSHTVQATAWYSTNLSGNSGFRAAARNSYSGGLGARSNSESTSAPHHALDNQGALELMLLDFGASFLASSLRIGWAPSSNSQYSGFEATPDIQVWTGGGLDALSLLGDCVASGCTGAGATLASQGFTQLATLFEVGVNSDRSLVGATAGRYMIVSGALGPQGAGGFDAFKLLAVSGEFQRVPEPSSALLLLAGLGVAGAGAWRRRVARER